MKKTALLVVLALLSGASVAWTLAPRAAAQDEEKTTQEDRARFEKKVRQCMELTGGKEQAEAAFDMMLGQFAQIPGLHPQFVEKFREKVTGQDMVELNVPLWMRHLDEKDVDVLIDFYRSPTGKKFVRVQPAMQQEAMLAGQKWGQEMALQVMAELDN